MGRLNNPRAAENLIPLNKRTPEERREISRLGGKARAAQMAERARFDEDIRRALSVPGVQSSIIAALISKAASGDIKAAEFLRDTIGERPADRQEVSATLSGTLEERQAAAAEEIKRLLSEK